MLKNTHRSFTRTKVRNKSNWNCIDNLANQASNPTPRLAPTSPPKQRHDTQRRWEIYESLPIPISRQGKNMRTCSKNNYPIWRCLASSRLQICLRPFHKLVWRNIKRRHIFKTYRYPCLKEYSDLTTQCKPRKVLSKGINEGNNVSSSCPAIFVLPTVMEQDGLGNTKAMIKRLWEDLLLWRLVFPPNAGRRRQ